MEPNNRSSDRLVVGHSGTVGGFAHGSGVQGGLFHPELPDGRAGAWLDVTAQGLVVVAIGANLRLEVPLSDVEVEVGGSSGSMIFFRHRGAGFTAFTESPTLLERCVAQPAGAPNASFERAAATLARKRRSIVGGAVATLLALVVIGALVVVAWQRLPEWMQAIVPTSVDRTIGEVAQRSIAFDGPKTRDPIIIETVDTVFRDIVAALPESERRKHRFKVTVIESETINAFALPGGAVYITTALLRLGSADQVAGVLGHEVSHVTERHAMTRMVRSLGLVGAAQLVLGDVAGALAVATELFTLATINAYGREEEHDADRLGVLLATRAGYAMATLPELFRAMDAASRTTDRDPVAATDAKPNSDPEENADGNLDPDHGESEPLKIPDWISTHPSTDDRVAAITQQLINMSPRAAAGTPTPVDWSRLQHRLRGDGLTPSPNPSNTTLEPGGPSPAPGEGKP